VKLKLTGQPFQVLSILLERPGEVVTREELQKRLWPDTFVDVDHNLNAAINKIREALSDSAESPRFVETLPRRGYRFVAPVTGNIPTEQLRPTVLTRVRWNYAGLAAAVLLLAGLAAYLMRSRPHDSSQPLTIVPFTTFPGFEASPSFSPDGTQIAFVWSRSEGPFSFEAYVKQIGQEHAVQLTHHPAIYLGLGWSPDGRFIALARRGNDDNDTGIYLLPALGGSERKLADATPAGRYPEYLLGWSPDGKWLAFSKEDAPTGQVNSASPQHGGIHLLNVETTEQRVLPDASPDCELSLEPAFSPDGKYLASVCMVTNGVNKIYVQPSEGGRSREVALVIGSGGFAVGLLEGLAWAADSQSLLYSSGGHLWRVPVGGGKPEKLPFAQDVQTPAVARTGNRLAYAQVNFPTNIWRLELTGPTKPAGPATRIISSSRGEGKPQVSPDGKHLAFESRRSGYSEVWVCDQDGSNPVQVTSFSGPETGGPHWSPDSHRIIFESSASGNTELYTVNADGGQLRRLSTGTPNASSPFWSADGRWIYFGTQGPGAIWKVAAEGGAALRLTKEGRSHPQESADGTRLFYAVGDHEIWSVLKDGGDERRETEMPTYASWTLARGGIYFLDHDRSLGRISFLDFATRHLQKLAELPGAGSSRDLSVSPDGRAIFYAQKDRSFADIMLVEGFR